MMLGIANPAHKTGPTQSASTIHAGSMLGSGCWPKKLQAMLGSRLLYSTTLFAVGTGWWLQ